MVLFMNNEMNNSMYPNSGVVPSNGVQPNYNVTQVPVTPIPGNVHQAPTVVQEASYQSFH